MFRPEPELPDQRSGAALARFVRGGYVRLAGVFRPNHEIIPKGQGEFSTVPVD